ncbi:MAG TPA: trehalase-like domain-containing protein [Archangium sp.]|nr:trehalase-like domain-containing protein [Archangium sp.]
MSPSTPGFRELRRLEGFLPIEDHGLIGDGKTAAMVGRDGAVCWMCVPRFDSPPAAAEQHQHDVLDAAAREWRTPDHVGLISSGVLLERTRRPGHFRTTHSDSASRMSNAN